ncbi:MAG TPA: hypothetical protein DEG69_10910 [Flavobacteriaceae bacterium]|nr:hypothetical protein [Flavobacteriaceae bacterium]
MEGAGVKTVDQFDTIKGANKMKLVKIKEAELSGIYNKTSTDYQKEITNKLISVDGNIYCIDLVNGTRLKITGKRNFQFWAKQNDYVTDF